MSIFKKPGELEVNLTIKILIYGQPGAGKSTLALSAPNPVLLDFDGGVQRVNTFFQCPTLQVHSWNEVQQAISELEKGETKCDTIVIDTAGKMLDFMGQYIVKNDSKMSMRDGSLSLKGYGARKVMFINFLKQVSMMEKNIVFVAHEKEDKDGDIRYVRPEMGGSSLGDLMKELDLVGYVQMIGNERNVSWSPQEKFYAKNTCNLPPVHKVSVIIDEKGNVIGNNTFLTDVFANYRNYLKNSQDIRKKYESLIADFSERIDGIKDVDSATSVSEYISKAEVVFTSKIEAKSMLMAKLAKLGIVWNKAKKVYEQSAA